ncbi:hypothetical protein CISG_10212 [Coccidioides immitis RMSCC 3703]|uniref:Uncharacterized protein n=1 Tax=Coccidioides immitis RMSCC 3703 TaxID=454286 RepID=A0A0J8TIS2_COCIT|nr:hypothetical protein CISG_10212 [Coccidioides immitis RMSCC 3703]
MAHVDKMLGALGQAMKIMKAGGIRASHKGLWSVICEGEMLVVQELTEVRGGKHLGQKNLRTKKLTNQEQRRMNDHARSPSNSPRTLAGTSYGCNLTEKDEGVETE